MSVRIIGGTFKGRKLMAPEGLATRPLLDRIKQSLFDILGQDLSGLTVVDCCAGSGSFGIEALSRGATTVHFIERAGPAQVCLKKNLQAVGQPTGAQLHSTDFQKVFPNLSGIDLLFADPPFPWFKTADPQLAEILTLGQTTLAENGQMVIRGEKGFDLPPVACDLKETDRRKWGRSWAAFLSRN